MIRLAIYAPDRSERAWGETNGVRIPVQAVAGHDEVDARNHDGADGHDHLGLRWRLPGGSTVRCGPLFDVPLDPGVLLNQPCRPVPLQGAALDETFRCCHNCGWPTGYVCPRTAALLPPSTRNVRRGTPNRRSDRVPLSMGRGPNQRARAVLRRGHGLPLKCELTQPQRFLDRRCPIVAGGHRVRVNIDKPAHWHLPVSQIPRAGSPYILIESYCRR